MDGAHVGTGVTISGLLAVLGWTYSRVLDNLQDWKARTEESVAELSERVAGIEGELRRIP